MTRDRSYGDASQAPPSARNRRAGPPVARSFVREEQAITFLICLAAPVYLALRDGGLGDVVREEVAIALFWAAALALSFRVIPRAKVAPRGRLIILTATLVIGWCALSLLWTESAERSFTEVTRDIFLVGVPVLCLLAINRETWTAAAAGLSVAAAGICALAVLTRLVPELVFEARLDSLAGDYRLSYPLDYWNAVACWGAMTTALGLGWSIHLKDVFNRGLALALVPLAATAVYLTYSRGGMLAMAVGAVAVIYLSRGRLVAAVHVVAAAALSAGVVAVIQAYPEIADGTGGDGAPFVALALIAACAGSGAVAGLTRSAKLERYQAPRYIVRLALGAAVVGVTIAGVAVANRIDGESFDSSEQLVAEDPATRLTSLAGSRDELWASALGAFAEHPATGVGSGVFDLWWMREDPDREAVRDAHSLALETLAERGLPGLLFLALFVGALMLGASTGRRASRRSVEAGAATALTAAFLVFVAQSTVDWMWESTAVSVLALASAGVATAGLAATRRRTSGSLTLRIALVVTAIGAGVIQIPPLVSDQRLLASQSALSDGDFAAARKAADDAVTAQPFAASPRAFRANIALGQDHIDNARDNAAAAVEREPTNPSHLFLLARIEVLSGEEESALDALARIAALSPAYEEVAEELETQLFE